jgi:hypothetical protein
MIHDLLLDAMPLVARLLDESPMMRHPGRVAIHLYFLEREIHELAFIEHHLHPLPICVGVLICAGDRVDAHRLPRLSEAFILRRSPLWPAAASSLLGHGLPLSLHRGRRGGDNRLVVLVVLAAFCSSLIFFVDDGLVFLLGLRIAGRRAVVDDVMHGVVAHSAEHTVGVLAGDAKVGRRGGRQAFLATVADGDATMSGRSPVEVDATRQKGVQIAVEAATMRVR